MKSKSFDVLGVLSASLCVLHCLAFPLLFVFPVPGGHGAWIDLAFLGLSTLAVVRVSRGSTRSFIKYLLLAGLGMTATFVALDIWLHIHTYLNYLGAGTLIVAHLINFRDHKH